MNDSNAWPGSYHAYRVTLKSHTGGKTSYVIKSSSLQEASLSVERAVTDNPSIQSYAIESIPAVPPNAMPDLASASFMLMGCLMGFAIAEYKIRKWLKG